VVFARKTLLTVQESVYLLLGLISPVVQVARAEALDLQIAVLRDVAEVMEKQTPRQHAVVQ
jgi:hypothetical protein